MSSPATPVLPDSPAPAEAGAGGKATPRLAEQALDDARASGDPARVASALVDLGLARIYAGDAAGGEALLGDALREARRLGHHRAEADALLGIGLAAIDAGDPARAREVLEAALAVARGAGDVQAEKAALERLGRAHRRLGDRAGALAFFEQAAAAAAAAGDGWLGADLLWRAGIVHAELGRRDRAIASAEEAVARMRRLGRPEAAWYARHLSDFLGAGGPAALPGPRPSPAPSGGAGGPGPLQMAYTAARSMARFAGSGFRMATPEAYRARLDACAACEHHAGLRCRACGCFTAAKAGLAHERCPIGKWPEPPE